MKKFFKNLSDGAKDVSGELTKAAVKVATLPVQAGAAIVDAVADTDSQGSTDKGIGSVENVAVAVVSTPISLGGELVTSVAGALESGAQGDFKQAGKEIKSVGIKSLAILATGGTIEIARSYAEHLRAQAAGKWQSLPDELVRLLSPHYKIDFSQVRYACGITINPTTDDYPGITLDHDIFFVDEINLKDKRDLNMMLHELEHVRQYHIMGGFEPFMVKHLAQSLQVGFIHDDISHEKQAIDKARRLINRIYNQYTAASSSLSSASSVSFLLTSRKDKDSDIKNLNTNPIVMSKIGDRLYIAENDRLHLVSSDSGDYKVLSRPTWGGTEAMTALGGYLYIVQNDHLHSVDSTDGSYKVLGAPVWHGAKNIGPVYKKIIKRVKLGPRYMQAVDLEVRGEHCA